MSFLLSYFRPRTALPGSEMGYYTVINQHSASTDKVADPFSLSVDTSEEGVEDEVKGQRMGGVLSLFFTGTTLSLIFLSAVALSMLYGLFSASQWCGSSCLNSSTKTGSSAAPPVQFGSYSFETSPSYKSCRAMRSRIATDPFHFNTPTSEAEVPAIGKLDLFQNDGRDQCITYADRYSRYTDEALGLTYRYNRSDLATIDSNVTIAPLQGPIKPANMDVKAWHDWQQARMKIVNSNFSTTMQSEMIDWRALMDGCGLSSPPARPKKRTVLLFRIYKGYVMTEDNIMNLRALLTEVSISQPAEGYDVRIVVNVPDGSGVYTSRLSQERILTPMLPREFWSLVYFWSAEEVRLAFPIGVEKPDNYYGCVKSDRPPLDLIPGVDCLGSDQLFAARHPEYDFIYHWEADSRFFGDYRTFIRNSEDFARKEPTSTDLRKYRHHYIPNSSKSASQWTDEKNATGRGEEPDLITFNPMFDPLTTLWSNYGWSMSEFYCWENFRYRSLMPERMAVVVISTERLSSLSIDRSSLFFSQDFGEAAPRLSSTIAFIRISARMYRTWGKAQVEHRKHLHCESWPSTLVQHSHLPASSAMAYHPEDKEKIPLKAVYVPHPLYFVDKRNTTSLEDNLLIPNLYHISKEGFLFGGTYHPIASYARDSYIQWRSGSGPNSCVRPHMVHPVKLVGY